MKATFINEYGMDAILKPVVRDIKKLVKHLVDVEGIYVRKLIGKGDPNDNWWKPESCLWCTSGGVS